MQKRDREEAGGRYLEGGVLLIELPLHPLQGRIEKLLDTPRARFVSDKEQAALDSRTEEIKINQSIKDTFSQIGKLLNSSIVILERNLARAMKQNKSKVPLGCLLEQELYCESDTILT